MSPAALALVVVARLTTQAPDAPTPLSSTAPVAAKPTVIALDDRAVKDQAPAALVQRTRAELERRRGIQVVLMSAARKRLDARGDKALSGCADDAGCLATAGRDMGADLVVTVRLTRRDAALFLAITRINALRPQVSDDAATLVGTDADALAYIPEGVGELFPDTELIPSPTAPTAPPAPLAPPSRAPAPGVVP